MTISTEIKVPFYSKARIYFRFWKNFQQQIKEAQIGNPPTKKSKQVVYDIAHRKKDMLKGAISEDIKKHFVDGQTDYFTVEEAEKRLKEFGTFTGEKHDVAYRKLPMQHKAIFLLEPLIKKYQTKIKSISNIGSGFDLIFEYLPPKYPKINFTSIDFGRTLERYHSVFPKQNNWNFMSGYALEMLQKGHLKSDVYLMSSTSVRFNNKELDLYIDEFAKHSKFVVFNMIRKTQNIMKTVKIDVLKEAS